jgi:prepilin-type processing-associated H-X9-DG protein
VVIAIIGILAAMLLPALNKAREKGYAAKCISNMHQWSLALNMYNDDWNDFYPYDGDANSPVIAVANSNDWFNVVPQYVNQRALADQYNAGIFPTVRNPNIWVCQSGTNKNPSVSKSQAVFYYSLSTCLHQEGTTSHGFKRGEMTAPSSTIVFCEEVEDGFPETNGDYDFVTRHSGGSNFVLGDGHVEWIPLAKYCRQNTQNSCPAPLGDIAWDNSSDGGDWKHGNTVPYHWWFFQDANTSAN